VCDLDTSRIGAPYVYDISSLRVKQTLDICCPEQNSAGQWDRAVENTHKKGGSR